MTDERDTSPKLQVAELRRTEARLATSTDDDRRRVADMLGIAILAALVLVGVLAIVSGESVGERGIGVLMFCGASTLLIVEAVSAFRKRASGKNGESDD